MKNKIIFLDCDGVLNRACLNGDKRYFVPECFKAFQSIVRRTKAKVVLSSSWREFPDWYYMLQDFLGAIGIELIGKTRELEDHKRADEIRDYLKRHADEVGSYVVIDDWDMRDDFPDNFVYTCEPGRIGLDQEWADEAVSILNRKKPKTGG